MLHRVLHVHTGPEGHTIEGVRMHEAMTNIAFLGRRRRVYARLVALSGARPGDRVLDIGCGGGYLARRLAAAVVPGGAVTGVDPSSPAIAHAKRRAPGNCTFATGVAQHLDLADGVFDVVTSTFTVHHVPQTEHPAVFSEMYRVTRPGGRLLVADYRPSRPNPFASPAMRHNNVELLEDLAVGAGFHVAARGDLPLLRYVQAVRPDNA